ncbi:MAG: hypothetical protein ABJA11_03335 [Pseudolysinimonas sp.]
MKRISYGSGSFVTGDAIAKAVLDYAAALANASKSAHLEVPGYDPAGSAAVSMVIGPASQILATDEEFGPELDDEAFVRDLTLRIEELEG